MKHRRKVITVLAGIVMVPAVLGQTTKRPIRVAYLTGYSAEVDRPLIAAFRRGMADHGYTESRNLVIDARFGAGDVAALNRMAKELAALKPDVFVVLSPQAARAAGAAAPKTPVVFANVQDPLASGLVKSLARPGGNMTGMSDGHAASVTKRLELIKEALPAVQRIGVMYNPTSATTVEQLKDVQQAAPRLRVSVVGLAVQSREDLETTFERASHERADALLLLGDIVLSTNMQYIAKRAIERRLPAVYTARQWTELGGFIAYGANFPDLYRRSASFVDKIVNGTKPADLPIEQATKFDLVINLRTARAIGVTVPRSVLQRADHLIE